MWFLRTVRVDVLFLCSTFALIALSFCIGFAFWELPGAIALSIDATAMLVCVGKTWGRRLGLRSLIWHSQLKQEEWVVLIVVVLYVTLSAFSPVQISH